LDPNISVAVIYAGGHENVETGEVQWLEMRAEVVWFGPEEALTLDIPFQRFLSEAEGYPEEGVWEPVRDTWEMWVFIHDRRGRLGRAEVWDWATNKFVGKIRASRDGKKIEGRISVSVDAVYQQVKVYSSSGPLLFCLRSRGGEVQYAVLPWCLGFKPNLPPSPNYCGPCEGTRQGRGDPYDVTGKEILPIVASTLGYLCKEYTNDQSSAGSVQPGVSLKKRKIVRSSVDQGLMLLIDNQASREAIEQASKNEDLTEVLEPISVLPYSEGEVSWNVALHGVIEVFIGVPYRRWQGATALREQVRLAGGTMAAGWSPGAVSAAALGTWRFCPLRLGWTFRRFPLRAQKAQWVERPLWAMRKEGNLLWRDKHSKLLAAIWAVEAQQMAKAVDRAANLMAPVTIRLRGDITCPGGGPGLIPGWIDITVVKATTTPEPPQPTGGEGAYELENGLKTIDLGKGWEYKVEGRPLLLGYEPPTPVNLQMPATISAWLTCTLKVLMELKVYTIDQNGNPIEAGVKLWERVRGEWVRVQETGSQPEDPTAPPGPENPCVATFNLLEPDVPYKLTANAMGPPGYGEKGPFLVRRGCEQTEGVVITLEEEPPGEEEPP